MPIIHMVPDEARNIAWELSDMVTLIHSDLARLTLAADKLKSSLSDPQLVSLGDQLQLILSELRKIKRAGDDLSLRVNKEVAKWETRDQSGASKFNGAANWKGTIAVEDLIVPPSKLATAQGVDIEKLSSADNSPEAGGNQENTDISGGSAKAETNSPTSGQSFVPEESSWGKRLANLQTIDQDIKGLEAKNKDALSIEEANHLSVLYDQRRSLSEIVESGISDEKPGPNNFPDGECTHYVANRRNVGFDLTGDAYKWVDAAQDSGWETGDVPVKGSIMVWQPGVHNAHEEYGHVSYVENVFPNRDGTFTVEYTDNLNGNVDAPTRVTIKPEEEGVHFIYDRMIGEG